MTSRHPGVAIRAVCVLVVAGACAGTAPPDSTETPAVADNVPDRAAAEPAPLFAVRSIRRPASAVGPATPAAAAVPPQAVPPSRDDLPFEPSERDRPSDGTGFTGHRPLPAGFPGGPGRGLVMGGVSPDGALGQAGLEDGDVLVSVAGIRIGPDDTDPVGEYRRRLAELRPESDVEVIFLRGDDPAPRTVTARLGRRPPRFDALDTPAEWLVPLPLDPRIAAFVDGVLELDGERERYESVLADQRESEATTDWFRLRESTQAHLHPGVQEALARALTDGVAADPAFALALAAGFPGVEPPALQSAAPEASLVELADEVEAFLTATSRRIEVALAAWSPAERVAIPGYADKLIERLDMGEYMAGDPDIERERAGRRLVNLLTQVDRAALLDAALRTETFLADALPRIAAAAEKDGRDGLLLARDTAAGRIEIWGGGDSRHNSRCAFRFDLAGDDRVLDVAGAADLDHPISIHVDWSGDDLYGATSRFRQGAALGGIGVLIDRAGDDQYLATGWSQGVALAGYALLLDVAGNDTYRGRDSCQGVALVGAGVLEDRAGADVYTGDRFCQGVGYGAGVGALVDHAGDDRYACTGLYGSEYGEPGVFSGWGQGVGFGFRGVTSGGIGICHDLAGSDVFEAGNFSQGGGYFYAWGILRDDRGDDRYVGSRYAMGFAAHQAEGTFLEGAGNDVYRSHAGVANGLSWDETAVLFHDAGGDDVYGTSGFSLGASAHNGMVVFLDDSGDDRYASPLGRAAPNDYHGGHSFALAVDAGGGDDVYGRTPAAAWNDRVSWKDDRAYVIDLPATPDALRTLLRAEKK